MSDDVIIEEVKKRIEHRRNRKRIDRIDAVVSLLLNRVESNKTNGYKHTEAFQYDVLGEDDKIFVKIMNDFKYDVLMDNYTITITKKD